MNGFDPIDRLLMQTWLRERCEFGPKLFDEAGALLEDWRAFARRHRREAGTSAEFASEMERRGYRIDRLVGDRNKIRWGLRRRMPDPCLGGVSKVQKADPSADLAPSHSEIFFRKTGIFKGFLRPLRRGREINRRKLPFFTTLLQISG